MIRPCAGEIRLWRREVDQEVRLGGTCHDLSERLSGPDQLPDAIVANARHLHETRLSRMPGHCTRRGGRECPGIAPDATVECPALHPEDTVGNVRFAAWRWDVAWEAWAGPVNLTSQTPGTSQRSGDGRAGHERTYETE